MKIKPTGELKLNDSPDFHIPTTVSFSIECHKTKQKNTLHVIRVVFNVECHKAKKPNQLHVLTNWTT